MTSKLALANTILLSLIILGFAIYLFSINKTKILRFFKKHQVLRFFANIFIPFVVPFVISIELTENINDKTFLFVIAMIVIATINLVVQLRIWIKEHKEDDIKWENAAAKKAYNHMYEAFMGKNIQLRIAYHNGLKQGMLTDADVPYDIFDQIRKIAWQFCCTISDITDIPVKDLDAAFIYHYSYKNATDNDKTWRWVTGKGTKFNLDLNNFVKESNSTFHHMIKSGDSSLFFNDKSVAIKEGKYQTTYKDYNHEKMGSLIAARVAFSSNDDTLCEGIIMINSYGKRFLDNSPEHTEDELKNMIISRILPCYRQLLTTELAMLYFRHQTDEDDKKRVNKANCSKRKFLLPKCFGEYGKSFKCLIATNKKIWKKDE